MRSVHCDVTAGRVYRCETLWLRVSPVSIVLLQMNVALIHDRLHIKTFWEKRITNQCRHAETEEQRVEKSALKKWETPHRYTAASRTPAVTPQWSDSKDKGNLNSIWVDVLFRVYQRGFVPNSINTGWFVGEVVRMWVRAQQSTWKHHQLLFGQWSSFHQSSLKHLHEHLRNC